MPIERRLRWTRGVVLLGIFLGYLSYGTGKIGLGELYPFADWRLYSEPVGINSPVSTHRVYVRTKDSDWVRQSLHPVRGFTLKESAYILNYWAREAAATHSDESTAALAQVGALFADSTQDYRVVEEAFYSFSVYEDAGRYDTSTVAVFHR